MKEIEEMCIWIKKNLGKDVPLHFSRAFPMNRMLDIQPTPIETLMNAKEIARKHLDFVYIGNIGDDANTNCPKCGALLVSRKHYNVISSIRSGKCSCGYRIPGIF
jgi:pyruvate formate lyase activating enzyme